MFASGDGSLAYNESFSHILLDAEQSFHGTEKATLTVTSHNLGARIAQRSVTLTGKVTSGLALVDRVRVRTRAITLDQPVSGDGTFSAPISLDAGVNEIGLSPLAWIPGDEISARREIDDRTRYADPRPFILFGDFPGETCDLEHGEKYCPLPGGGVRCCPVAFPNCGSDGSCFQCPSERSGPVCGDYCCWPGQRCGASDCTW